MQYVDLGKFQPGTVKKRKKSRFWRLSLLVLGLFIGLYVLGLLFWPTGNVIRQVLNAPLNALSDPLKNLKSTDGRTNILILGIDKRKDIPYKYRGSDGKTHYNGFLTDTMIVASLDLKNKDVVLISLPRDLWVTYGGNNGIPIQASKINAVYSAGTTNQYPGGGIGLDKQVLEKILGLPMHYGIRVDFEAFRSMIDIVGGVTVNVDNSFQDYEYPIEGKEEADCGTTTIMSPEGTPESVPVYGCRYLTVKFTKGETKMDGTMALQFVRSRHGNNDEGSDFARAARQQKIIIALKNKILSTQTLFDPIKMAKLINDFGDKVETDFDFSNVPALLKVAKDFDDQKVRNIVLTPDTNQGILINPPGDDYGGAWVLVPRDATWQEVKNYIKQNLTPPPPPAISATSTPTPTTGKNNIKTRSP